MLRYLTALVTAGFVTLALFYFMQYLISGEHAVLTPASGGGSVEIVRLKRAEVSAARQRHLPEPPKQQQIPDLLQQPVAGAASEVAAPQITMPLPGLPALTLQRNLLSGVSTEATTAKETSEVIALLKVEPDYPRQAARKGIEGWVKLGFSVLEDGSVANIKVLDAKPKRVFDKAAKRALRRWKFKPQLVNGTPVKQQAVQVIEFNLN